MIKAVIFDLDNTLCNSTVVIEDVLRSTFTKHFKDFPNKKIDDLISINIKIFENLISDPDIPLSTAIIRVWFDVFEQLQIKPSLKIILRLMNDIHNQTNGRIQLIDGSLELVNYLKSKGIKIGVLTNGIFIDQAKKLVKLKLDVFIDYLVTSDMCASDKPDSRIFKYLLNKLAVSPNQAIMIGDDYVADIKGAHDFGIKTIYFKYDNRGNIDKKGMKPDYTETNYKDILKLVKRLTPNQKEITMENKGDILLLNTKLAQP